MKSFLFNILNPFLIGLTGLSLLQSAQVKSQNNGAQNNINSTQISYDYLASNILESNIIVDIMIKKIKKLSESQTTTVPSNRKRVLIIAEVQALIRGENGINSEIRFLFDAPIDSRGKLIKLKKRRFIAFGHSIEGRLDFIRLVEPSSITSHNSNVSSQVRSITAAALENNAPQAITGVSSAFHSPGTVIGEGETQIFLDTEFGQPMAISITSRSGEEKRWSVSTSEVIDINANEPLRDSLLGYRLACNLPNGIESSALESSNRDNNLKAAADYRFVREAIGPCKI